jgi:lysine 6-dehydrogenase
MKALVVGCGKVGSEIARDLALSKEVSALTAVDAQSSNLNRIRGTRKVTTVKASLSDKKEMRSLMEEADIVCGALPGRIGFQLLEQAVDAGKNIVDISYTPKNPLGLNRKAIENDCTVVPQCGVAPGFTNMCVGDASTKMDEMRKVRCYVGGVPEKPVPPLNYRIVFSLDDVINEYTRPVHVIENGTRKIVEPLTGRGSLNFPGVGPLEYFLTDGLGTLPSSFPNVREMYELTLRYPGHAQIVDALRRLGFFSTKPVKLDGSGVEPRRLSLEVLRQAFGAGSPEDLLALRVEVEGVQHGKRTMISYTVLDRFDRRRKVSAMARTTAYPATSAALLLGKGMIPKKGVVPPEKIAKNSKLFRFTLSRLRERGVGVRIQSRTPGS